jgi:beta-lactamase class A
VTGLRAVKRPLAGLCLVAVVACSGSAEAPAAASEGIWTPDVEAARSYAAARQGRIRFAIIDDSGKFRGHRWARTAPMASVFKVMLLATYLRRARDRALTEGDRDLLAPMIRWSDNDTAQRVRDIVGPRAIRRLARDADMRHFRLHSTWGLSRTSARDQAHFLYRFERDVPDRHERYARRLLHSIVPSQRWGIPKVIPGDWEVYFKGGWGTGTGRVTHQVAFLESGDERISVAILTEFSPSHRYGTRTVRGVAVRLLQGL